MRSCVFCARPAGSREHVIPKWLDKPINASHPVGDGMLRIGLIHRYSPGDDQPQRREWTPRGPDLVSTAVCHECNTVWLASLENKIKPILGPMVLGNPTSIASADQPLLATWCYKTILLMQLVRSRAPVLIPRERYGQFFEQGRPPSDTRIWLGTCALGGNVLHDAGTEITMTTLRSSVPGYLAVLTLGRLLVLCGGRSRESDEPLRVETPAVGKTLRALWPASVRALDWPPPELIVDVEFATLAQLL